jgi:hypothetical protein
MKEESTPAVETKPAEKPFVSMGERALLTPTSAEELSLFLTLLSKGGAFPASFDTQEKRVAVYQMARSLMGDRWQLAVNHIADIKGRMCIYGELPRAIAEQTREVEEFRLFTVDDQYLEINVTNKNLNSFPFAGVCDVKRKGRSLKQYAYTLEEAKKAGQFPGSRPDAPWNKFTRIMLMRKAQALGVKFEFPDAILGCPIAEYDYNLAPDLEDVIEVAPETPAKLLNTKFGGLRD